MTNKKNKVSIILLFVILALAIPFAFCAGFMLLFIVGNYSLVDWSQFSEAIQGIAALITTFLGTTYVVTYIFSLIKTIENKELRTISFLPVFHGLAALFMLFIWYSMNQMFGKNLFIEIKATPHNSRLSP